MNPSYFLDYQARYLADQSRFKIVEKSRRVGFTYVQSYEDVRDAARAEGAMDVWFSSADETAAREYLRYCEQWARMFDKASRSLGEITIDEDNDIKAFSIEFASGKRINALSSNPKAFRSKGGKLVLDEYAFHKNPEEMWKAAIPIITWGFPVRVLSTYNGKGNRYYRLVTEAKKPGARWSLHTVTIESAIADGLVDKIMGRAASHQDCADFLADCRAAAGDDDTYNQEYMCIPVDEASAWLTWELITSGEHKDAGRPELYQGGPCFGGWDVARKKHGSILWIDEMVGDVGWARYVVNLSGQKFSDQLAEVDAAFDRFDLRRLSIDETGMGIKIVEDAQDKYGARVEGVLFSAANKLTLATLIKQRYEDKRVRAPEERRIRDSHHAVKKMPTAAGNARFDADASETGHADEFWAHALAIYAADAKIVPVEFRVLGGIRESSRLSDYGLPA